MPSKAEENLERIRVLRNDQAVREGLTLLRQTSLSDPAPGGRFAKAEHLQSKIVQGEPDLPKLPASSPWSNDPVPNEPALGHSVDEVA
jgi:hypothetical protein